MRVHVSEERVELTPGMPTLVQVDVFNDTEIIDGYRVAVHGFEADGVAGTATVEPGELSLFPDTEGTAFVHLTVPPSFPAGRVPLVLEVTSTIDAGRTSSVRLEVTVAEVREAELRVEPQQVTGGRRAWLTVTLANRGNVAVDAGLSGADQEQAVAFAFTTNRVAVARGREESVHAWVAGRRPLVGSPAPRMLTVTAHGTGEPLEASATFLQKPIIPRAALTLLAIVGALALWGALLFRGVDTAAEQVAAQVNEPSGSMVTGVVTDGQAPLGGVEVRATGGRGEHTTTTLTEGAVGSFAFSGLPSRSTFVLTFVADGYAPQSHQIQTPAGDAPIDVGTITLGRAGGSISGTVTGPDGAPVGGATVTATQDGAVVASATTATTGSIGFYVLAGLPTPATYALTFSLDGFATQSKVVNLAAGADAPDGGVQLAADTSGVISGLVSRAPAGGGACAPGTCGLGGVRVVVTDGTTSYETTTATQPVEQAGRYTVGGLAGGTYTVTFTRDGYESQSTTVTLPPRGGFTVDGALPGSPGGIAGSAVGCSSIEVRTRTLAPLQPALVAAPGADGAFAIGGIPTPGDYRVLFNGPTPVVVDVTLDGGEQRSLGASCAATAPPPTAPPTTPPSAPPDTTPTSEQGGITDLFG